MTISSERKNLIDRITKLLALAEDPSAKPGEADNAKAMAAKLMAKHNIAISETAMNESDYETFDDENDVSGDNKFDVTMCQAVARFNGCLLLLCKSLYGKKIQVCGTRPDVEAYNYMRDVVYRQRTDNYLKHIINTGEARNEKNKREYYMGFAYGVNKLVHDLMAKRDVVINSMALVPVDQVKRAEDWFKKNVSGIRTRQTKLSKYSQAGYEAGRNARLNKGVNSNGNNQLALGR